ncbi:N-acyl-phosphatidylethanolamine-hydrolyzing phospholipase D [Lactarius hengduanensis]|nr:N-acyl-phosphatidylethanolamine-hydrolyzing phospholipase D [Lactarius hengduanensis]
MSTNSPPSIEVTEPPRRFPSGYVDGHGVRPSHHMNDSKTRFTNPWPSFRAQTYSNWLSVRSFTQNIGYFNKSSIPAQSPTWDTESGNEDSAKATWLGYPMRATLSNSRTPPGAARGVRVIFDPVFSNRYTPCKVEEIPAIDAIVLSVRQYSSNDLPLTIPTLYALLENPFVLCAYFPLCTPHSRIHELDWWDERLLHVALPSMYASDAVVDAEVRLSCTPSQHVSGRTASDRWHALWAAWVVDDLRSHKKVYFAGDTGYRTVRDGEDEDEVPVCPAFAEVGERFGGLDLALLPIGAYEPRAIVSNEHASPADAVRIFKDLKAKKALAMHWGTWVLGTEPVLEPPMLLRKECEKAGLGPDEFLIPALGGTCLF